MNARSVISGLILIIVSLLAGVVYLLVREPFFAAVGGSGVAIQTNVITRVAVRKFGSTNYFVRPSGFRWSSLESTNYPLYIENLRSVGCPEETIRDIIIADVAKLYANRRAALFSDARSGPFWKTENPWDRSTQQALKALELEQRNLIKQLLEVDLEGELDKFANQAPARPFDLGFLPEEKRAGVLAVRERYRLREAELHDAASGIWSEADDEGIRRMERDEEQELKAILSPEEFEDYQLRHSPLSADLRSQLNGFEPTEEEFRKIFQLRGGYEHATAQLKSNGDSTLKGDMQEVLNAELKRVLGEERYGKYEKLQEPAFQTLNRLGDRFGLPAAITDQAYSFLHAAEAQALQLYEDPNLEDDQRDEALRKMSEETSRAMSRVLGPEAFRVFQGAGGNSWLDLGLPSR